MPISESIQVLFRNSLVVPKPLEAIKSDTPNPHVCTIIFLASSRFLLIWGFGRVTLTLSPKLTRLSLHRAHCAPKKVVGCRGEGRYVVGCRGGSRYVKCHPIFHFPVFFSQFSSFQIANFPGYNFKIFIL